MAPSVNRNKSGANTGASNKTVKSGRVTKQPLRDWSKYTHIPPNADQISSNGRQTGRNLITWNRKSTISTHCVMRLFRPQR